MFDRSLAKSSKLYFKQILTCYTFKSFGLLRVTGKEGGGGEERLLNLYNKLILLNDGQNNSGSKIITGIQLDEP